MSANPQAATVDLKRRKRAFRGAIAGHLIEWYDYGAYGFLAVYIGQLFFPANGAATELLSSFAVFALSFFVRPLGGVFFGPMADRVGRKRTLLAVMVVMTGSTFMIGLLPTHASIGVVAPIALILARCAQGFSAGGEIGTTTSFIAEYAGPGRRGYSTSWLMVTAVAGLMLGGVVANGLIAVLGNESMLAWGWRIPFLIAGPLGLIALFIRLKLEDSPEFEAIANAGTKSDAPLREALHFKRPIVLIFCIITLHASVFYLIVTYASTYMSKTLGFDDNARLALVFVSCVVAAVVMPFGGVVTDRYGRRNFLLVTGFLTTVSVIWFFEAGPGATPTSFVAPLVITSLCLGLYASSTYATMSDLLPTRVRSTGIALAYNLPVALFGGSAPLISTWLVARTGNIASPWYFYVATCFLSLIALVSLRTSDFEAAADLNVDDSVTADATTHDDNDTALPSSPAR
ncbi:MFS transporter [Rhodococcus sp. JVH1]|uniref:MFS transporter n=1 Tax=Rhodococcus sp. JVH1 TaxID=745408 RepID=UPI00027212B8|nr:MFS transporter [Rhodococcus sp. JVH1]EJI98400.1 sugar (and other) transporter family protein [Rhodococcus sp. JVH1]